MSCHHISHWCVTGGQLDGTLLYLFEGESGKACLTKGTEAKPNPQWSILLPAKWLHVFYCWASSENFQGRFCGVCWECWLSAALGAYSTKTSGSALIYTCLKRGEQVHLLLQWEAVKEGTFSHTTSCQGASTVAWESLLLATVTLQKPHMPSQHMNVRYPPVLWQWESTVSFFHGIIGITNEGFFSLKQIPCFNLQSIIKLVSICWIYLAEWNRPCHEIETSTQELNDW